MVHGLNISDICPDEGTLCYTVNTSPVTWLAAEQACFDSGGELAQYDCDSIPTAVRASVQPDSVWVTQSSSDTHFTWLDGSDVTRRCPSVLRCMVPASETEGNTCRTFSHISDTKSSLCRFCRHQNQLTCRTWKIPYEVSIWTQFSSNGRDHSRWIYSSACASVPGLPAQNLGRGAFFRKLWQGTSLLVRNRFDTIY